MTRKYNKIAAAETRAKRIAREGKTPEQGEAESKAKREARSANAAQRAIIAKWWKERGYV